MKLWAIIILVSMGFCPRFAAAQPEPAQDPMTGAAPQAPPDAGGAPPKTEKLPTLEELPPRTMEQLLKEKPRDWVVLNAGGVLEVEPVSPRPDTVKKIQDLIAQKEAERRRLPATGREAITEEIEQLGKLAVTLVDEPNSPEYALRLGRIQQIIHHEDHMIRALDGELKAGQIPRSLELLTLLQRNTPDWPGIVEAGQRVLFADAVGRLQRGRAEEALVLLEELRSRNAAYPLLADRLGDAVRALCDEALTKSDYRRAHFYLTRLRTLDASHPLPAVYTQQMTQLALARMREADEASQRGEYATAAKLAEEAVVIQPRAGELRAAHRRHADRHQVLHVGVLSFPGERRAYPVRDAAEERELRLTRIPLFETQRVRDGSAYYRTRVFDEWEPFDLGRTMRFTLRPFRQPSELQGVVTTGDVAGRILALLDPRSPAYDERLSSFVESVRVLSPREFEVKFQRVPARIEPLLSAVTLPLPEETNSDWGEISEPGGFRLASSTPVERRYLRRLPEPEGLPKYHLAEIVEHRYESPDKALQALSQNEISAVPNLPDWIIRRMAADEEFLKKFFVQRYALPRTHVLQFHPESRPLRVRELRAALAYSIDRERLLRDRMLRDPTAEHGRLVTAPYLHGSPATNVLVPQRRHDLSAAFAMGLAAKKQLEDEVPTLRMLVPQEDVAEAVAEDIARVWRQIGLKIEVIRAQDSAPESWDVLYRTLEMTEPVTQMWPFLTFSSQARIEDLDAYPDWLKQELVQLDRTSDQLRAITAAQTLHRHLAEDVAFIPLWEVDRFLVFRKNVLGYPQRPLHEYENIDQWTVEPLFPAETP